MLSDATLPAACRAYREGFPATATGRHGQGCPACTAWAVHRQAVAVERRTKRSMPPALSGRLRAIPQQVRRCPDAEILVRIARDQARGRTAPPAVVAHLAGCADCQALLAVLSIGFAAPPHRLPRSLAVRLRNVGPRIARRGFVWAFDLRAASFAALLIGLLLVPVAEPAAAWARQAGSVVTSPLAEWRASQDRSAGEEGRLAAAFEPARKTIAETLRGAHDRLSIYFDSWASLTARTRLAAERVLSLLATEPASPNSQIGDDDHDHR